MRVPLGITYPRPVVCLGYANQSRLVVPNIRVVFSLSCEKRFIYAHDSGSRGGLCFP